MIFVGLLLGIACGVFFGERCQSLAIVGDAFIGLLRMTVLPYIVVSLVANLGKLSLHQSRRLAIRGGVVLLLLWAIALVTIGLLPTCFPDWKAGSFFSTAITDPPIETNLLDFFIPSNVFNSLARNHVPAVVLICIFLGLALGGVANRKVLIDQLDVLSKVLLRVSSFITKLAPLGVFAIAAATAGTISLSEVARLQAYFLAYTGGTVVLTFVVLPLLVITCTPFTYREVMSVARAPMLTAFATGKLIIVLPMLIEKTDELFSQSDRHLGRSYEGGSTAPAVDVLYPIAYPFPHVGKLLGMLFIPFAAWFLGNAMTWDEYPSFLGAGLMAYFGGPILATPFLLDQMHLPHDMFQLFLLSGVYTERLGDALGAMHLVAFTLLTTCAFSGKLRISLAPVAKYVGVVLLVGVTTLIGMRMLLANSPLTLESRGDVITQMQLIEQPVESVVIREAAPNPMPMRPGESLLERIRRRGVLRVGYNEDKLPFAFFNGRGDLVGFDINMAHALARDLGVTLEFVRFDRDTLAKQLAEDDFDMVMSGLVGTLERAEAMQHTTPYMDVTLALVVPDYRVRSFQSIDSMQEMQGLRIGYVDLSSGFVSRLREELPNAILLQIATNREFFESLSETPQPNSTNAENQSPKKPDPRVRLRKKLDALLISAESGSAFTLLYPEFEVVTPTRRKIALPLFYAIGARDVGMRDFLEHWVTLRKNDGTIEDYYDHWVLGKDPRAKPPRWNVAGDVLGWGE